MATLWVPAGRLCQLNWGRFSPLQPKPLKLKTLSMGSPSRMSVLFEGHGAGGQGREAEQGSSGIMGIS